MKREVKVMAAGVFDIIHLGHVLYLRAAKALGTHLTVVVACNKTAEKMKHKPVVSQENRVQMMEELKSVDRVILGGEGDRYDVVRKVKPDIIAIGFDQVHNKERMEEELAKRKIKCRVVRLDKFASDLDSTSRLIEKILVWSEFNDRMKKVEGK